MSTVTPDLSDFKPDTSDLSDFTPDSAEAPPSKYQGMVDAARALYRPENAARSFGLMVGGGVQNVGETSAIGSLISRARSAIGLPENPPIPPGAKALATLPPTGARPAAQTGEALAAIPRGTPASTETPSQVVPLNIPQPKGGNPYVGSRVPATMEPAQSTTIGLHGYHPESQTMTVQFKNGSVYEYRGVPPEVYNAYQNSESQGSFFANNIKGRYNTNKLGVVGKTPGQKAKASEGRHKWKLRKSAAPIPHKRLFDLEDKDSTVFSLLIACRCKNLYRVEMPSTDKLPIVVRA